MVPNQKRVALAVAALLPPLALVGFASLWLDHSLDHPDATPGGLLGSIWRYRHTILIVLSLASIIGPLLSILYAFDQRRHSIQHFLDHMHARFWTKKGQRDSEYRISLYIPALLSNDLKCYYRTDRKRSRKTWSQQPPRDDRCADGVVGAVWVTGMSVQVGSPPDNPTEQELSDYRLHSHMRATDHDDRSWPCAAMMGIPVQELATGNPIGVLLVERNKSMAKIGEISLRDLEQDVQVCAMILQGQL